MAKAEWWGLGFCLFEAAGWICGIQREVMRRHKQLTHQHHPPDSTTTASWLPPLWFILQPGPPHPAQEKIVLAPISQCNQKTGLCGSTQRTGAWQSGGQGGSWQVGESKKGDQALVYVTKVSWWKNIIILGEGKNTKSTWDEGWQRQRKYENKQIKVAAGRPSFAWPALLV